MRTRRLAAIGLALGLSNPGLAAAQQVHLEVPQGPLWVGTAADLRITAEGFDEEPQPEVDVPSPASGRLELVGVSPQVRSSVTIINNQITQTKEVRFAYQFRFLASEPGTIEVGPFTVSQGPTRRSTEVVRLQIREVPLSDRIRVRVRLPDEARYVGEHIPVTLEFWLESGLQSNLYSYTLRAPIFEPGESFQLLDDPEAKGEIEVNIETDSGTLRLSGSVTQVVSDDQRFSVVSVTRTLIPLRSGTYTIEPASIVANELTQWERGFLIGRRAVRKLRATDRALRLEVKPVPREGMPPSFAGAVGRGFALEVTADRTIVQVGDPITLRFTLRGEGNLESAGLPPLDAEGLLPAAEFRVPEGDLPGRYENGQKEFTTVVRVLDENVREIPPLAYSWFDAQRKSYETTRSRAIALSVRPAEVVAAEDVFSAGAPEQETAQEEPPLAGPAADRGAFTLTGADLAIEREVSRLLAVRPGGLNGPWVPVGLYSGASLLVLAALLDRRRRDVDPALIRRRRKLEAELRSLRDAAHLPGEEAVAEIARALRRMLAEVPEARTNEIDALLGECDARSYAPAGEQRSAPLDREFHTRAVDLGRAIAERVP